MWGIGWETSILNATSLFSLANLSLSSGTHCEYQRDQSHGQGRFWEKWVWCGALKDQTCGGDNLACWLPQSLAVISLDLPQKPLLHPSNRLTGVPVREKITLLWVFHRKHVNTHRHNYGWLGKNFQREKILRCFHVPPIWWNTFPVLEMCVNGKEGMAESWTQTASSELFCTYTYTHGVYSECCWSPCGMTHCTLHAGACSCAHTMGYQEKTAQDGVRDKEQDLELDQDSNPDFRQLAKYPSPDKLPNISDHLLHYWLNGKEVIHIPHRIVVRLWCKAISPLEMFNKR